MGRYGEIWGDMGEMWAHGEQGRYGEIWGDMGRYGEIWGDVGRCGEIWGDMGRYGEIWGRCGRTVSTVRAPGAAGGTHTYTRYACSLGVVSPTHP